MVPKSPPGSWGWSAAKDSKQSNLWEQKMSLSLPLSSRTSLWQFSDTLVASPLQTVTRAALSSCVPVGGGGGGRGEGRGEGEGGGERRGGRGGGGGEGREGGKRNTDQKACQMIAQSSQHLWRDVVNRQEI